MFDQLVTDTRIGSADFGDYHYQRHLAWSFVDRQSKAALLRNMAAARIDANEAQIDRKLQFYADLYNITLEQLMQRIMEADERKTSIAKLHQVLAAEAGLGPEDLSGSQESNTTH